MVKTEHAVRIQAEADAEEPEDQSLGTSRSAEEPQEATGH